MKTILAMFLLGVAGLPALVCAQGVAAQGAGTATLAPDRVGVADSQQMEKDLQRLPWKQFRSVVEAVPKLRAEVEVYGDVGWQMVQTNYTRYPWQKNIDKLDAAQKKQLAELIRAAKAAR